MKKALGLLALALAAMATPAAAETPVKVGWCARTVSSAAAPFAIATKMGWFKDAGISVELVPLPGSTDCVKLVGTGDLAYSLPSVEPLASLRPQGLKAKVFYTAYQGNIYGPAVPADSPLCESRALRKAEAGWASEEGEIHAGDAPLFKNDKVYSKYPANHSQCDRQTLGDFRRATGATRPSSSHYLVSKAARSTPLLLLVLRDPRLYQLLHKSGRERLVHREADGAFGCGEALEFVLERLDQRGTHREKTAMV